MAIYQARFNRYLQDRGLKDTAQQHVWAFLGDGESDEPESLGALTLAVARAPRQPDFHRQLQPAAARRPRARQRQDHSGAGSCLPRCRLECHQGDLGRRLGRLLGQRQDRPARQAHERGGRRRISEIHRRAGLLHPRAFFRQVPGVARAGRADFPTSSCTSCDAAATIPQKVYAAYDAAVKCKGGPTVILAKTIKGYGLGEAGEGRNTTHQQKKLNEEELVDFRNRFGIPLSDKDVRDCPFYQARRR